ncbi:unnamed protein product [Caenorhabditis auriculariae]|uniref:Uncharacterized protein n=1 Tax=Caenorhabditis auriculariae TaxID=2777116 RepID=A0A8S1GRJ1_9PELO|nr:unnamed protein product [Caenorhabditis auriculariae]
METEKDDVDEELKEGDIYIEALMEIEKNEGNISGEVEEPFNRDGVDEPFEELIPSPEPSVSPEPVPENEQIDLKSLILDIEKKGIEKAYFDRFEVKPCSWITWVKMTKPRMMFEATRHLEGLPPILPGGMDPEGLMRRVREGRDSKRTDNYFQSIKEEFLNIVSIFALKYRELQVIADMIEMDLLAGEMCKYKFEKVHGRLPLACHLLDESEIIPKFLKIVDFIADEKNYETDPFGRLVVTLLEGARWKEDGEVPEKNCELFLIEEIAPRFSQAGPQRFKELFPIDWIQEVVAPEKK